MGEGSDVDVAVDNDIALKAVCYGLVSEFWPEAATTRIGILGAAPYVIATCIERADLGQDKNAVQALLREFIGNAEVLEPSDSERVRSRTGGRCSAGSAAV